MPYLPYLEYCGIPKVMSYNSLVASQQVVSILHLFRIFEYVTVDPSAGPLSANWWDVEKLNNFCSDGYFEFWVKNLQNGVKICHSDEPFLGGGLTGFWLMADWVIFNIGWVVDKACIYTMKGQW